jgi:hypothetical protein
VGLYQQIGLQLISKKASFCIQPRAAFGLMQGGELGNNFQQQHLSNLGRVQIENLEK